MREVGLLFKEFWESIAKGASKAIDSLAPKMIAVPSSALS
jgi:hypothetical protein